ncbi:Sensor histidine kinase/response regulator [Pseudomonas batumici]|uniref:Sensor histidine kinase/response regulator n=1 Tax=Pseudomonas batumici TaxID=226910 RepID=A0A0C2IDA5_9PSED|nr:Sensor histidine kinase/response regulator [Pseudomonas batumici]
MDIKFTHRLSYKQARLTVLVGFILGTLLSLLQIGIDYASESASINGEILSLMEISHNPASRIAYNIDAELAQELALGLLRSPAVLRAQLIDNNNVVLASVERPRQEGSYRLISDWLFGANRSFEDRLFLSHLPDESLGTLHLDIDTYTFGIRFLHRAEVTLINGFARSLILTLILLVLFYTMLDSLLQRLAPTAVPRIDPSAMKALGLHDWPGNIRELRNVLERARLFTDDGVIRVADLPAELRRETPMVAAQGRRGRNELEQLAHALAVFDGPRSELAKTLGMSERTLYRRLQALEGKG